MMETRVLFSVMLPLLYIDKNIFFPCSPLISQRRTPFMNYLTHFLQFF